MNLPNPVKPIPLTQPIKPIKPIKLLALITIFNLITPIITLATQTHGEPEGLYAHQWAHLFFIFSMAILIYWLRAHDLIRSRGWRYIQYAAMLFILWNVDTVLVHFLDEQVDIIRITQVDDWRVQIVTQPGYAGLGMIYYLAKLDHLICVPAMWFLYRGLKKLYRDNNSFPAKPEHT